MYNVQSTTNNNKIINYDYKDISIYSELLFFFLNKNILFALFYMYSVCIWSSNVHNQCKNYKIFIYIIVKLKKGNNKYI